MSERTIVSLFGHKYECYGRRQSACVGKIVHRQSRLCAFSLRLLYKTHIYQGRSRCCTALQASIYNVNRILNFLSLRPLWSARKTSGSGYRLSYTEKYRSRHENLQEIDNNSDNKKCKSTTNRTNGVWLLHC